MLQFWQFFLNLETMRHKAPQQFIKTPDPKLQQYLQKSFDMYNIINPNSEYIQ
jgi:hypothetical protein